MADYNVKTDNTSKQTTRQTQNGSQAELTAQPIRKIKSA